jgi:hypothetical protein
MEKTFMSSGATIIPTRYTYNNANNSILEAKTELENLMKEIQNIDPVDVLKLASISTILEAQTIQALEMAQTELSNIANELLANPAYRTSLYHNLEQNSNGYNFVVTATIPTTIGQALIDFSKLVKNLIF